MPCIGHLYHLSEETWEKLLLLAHDLENSADVSVIASRNTSQMAVMNFAAATGATPNVGYFQIFW